MFSFPLLYLQDHNTSICKMMIMNEILALFDDIKLVPCLKTVLDADITTPASDICLIKRGLTGAVLIHAASDSALQT